MRILLIDILRTSLEDVWPSAEHSLGLMYLAAAVRNDLGDKVELTIWPLVSKPKQSDHDVEQVNEKLEEFRPDVVGVRSLSIGKGVLRVVAQTVKTWNPSCFLVVGGPYATDDPADVLRHGTPDCVVIGEGEETFRELVSRLSEKQRWDDVAGIAYRRNGTVHRTPARPLITNLDSLPLPDYSVIDVDRFSNRFLTFTAKISKPHANIMTTRGCPYRCAYCHNILGKLFRKRSAENVLEEIRFVHDTYGITDFQVIDDIFNLDLDRAKAICDLIIRSGMKLTLSFPNALRGDRVDDELIDKMAEAGTRFVSYAVETASPRLQRLIRKNLNLDKVHKAIERTTQVGIVTRGFFMIGFPTETEQEVRQTIEFAKSSALCGATFFTVVYFPGTELYRLAQSMGYFQDTEYEVQRDYVNVADGPYEFDLTTLASLKQNAIKEFAFTKDRIDQVLRLLPGYFSQREIDGFFMAYVISSRASLEDIDDESVRERLRRHFVIADNFSQKHDYYV